MLKEENKKEKGPLERIFFSSPSKILDYLSSSEQEDNCASDIATASGLSKKTVILELNNLLKEHVVVHTRTVGRSKMYKLNEFSKKGQNIQKFVTDT